MKSPDLRYSWENIDDAGEGFCLANRSANMSMVDIDMCQIDWFEPCSSRKFNIMSSPLSSLNKYRRLPVGKNPLAPVNEPDDGEK